MAKNRGYGLGNGNVASMIKAREKRRMNSDDAFMEFFEILDQAVTPFKSGHKMPKANVGDSRVSIGREKGKNKIKFEFLAKPNHQVIVKIDPVQLAANTEEYIHNMLECLDQGMKQAKSDSVIIVPTFTKEAGRMELVK